jgi:hypothetical protein
MIGLDLVQSEKSWPKEEKNSPVFVISQHRLWFDSNQLREPNENHANIGIDTQSREDPRDLDTHECDVGCSQQ